MNKDDVAGLVERLLVPDVYGYQGRKQAEEANTLRQEAADALTTLSAERDDLRRRLDNICMDIHTCNGDDCERPVCVERRKNAILSARVETLEAALRRCFKGETQAVRNERVLEAIENYTRKALGDTDNG